MPYELTEAEKEKIRAEMDYRAAIAHHVAPTRFNPGKSQWMSQLWLACNQPVVITILGGLLLAGFGATLQDRNTEQQQNKARTTQVIDKKYDLLFAFSTNVERYVDTVYNQRSVTLWLNQPHKPTDTYYGGRTRTETKKFRNEVLNHLMSQVPAGVYLNQIEALYNCSIVSKHAEKLRNQVTFLEEGTFKSDRQIDSVSNSIDMSIQLLATDMGTEIKGACPRA